MVKAMRRNADTVKAMRRTRHGERDTPDADTANAIRRNADTVNAMRRNADIKR